MSWDLIAPPRWRSEADGAQGANDQLPLQVDNEAPNLVYHKVDRQLGVIASIIPVLVWSR